MKLPISTNLDFKLAIIADIHLHDIDSQYDFPADKLNPLNLTLRSWADTRRSSRVFNESKSALIHALGSIAQRGIRHVVILGDYSDDGQVESVDRFSSLLTDYQTKFDLRFYVLPGNHDYHGPYGKHQSTRFATAPGQSVLVTSKKTIAETEPETAVLSPNMFCRGIPENILPLADFGLFKQSDFLHWETPFGNDDSVQSRLFTIYSADQKNTYQMMDASYLVEPEDGLWLLMVDANVNEPRDGNWHVSQKGAFKSSTDAGWNAVLDQKAHLLDWITDVYHRAKKLNKTVLFFSHYPVLDPYRDLFQHEKRLFGETEAYKRTPRKNVGEILLSCGAELHFGGHLHVNASTSLSTSQGHLTDIAVPSLVAFPPAFKVIHAHPDGSELETIRIKPMILDEKLLAFYRAEQQVNRETLDLALAQTEYDQFHYHRLRCRVIHHYLPKYWPTYLQQMISNCSVCQLVAYLINESIENQETTAKTSVTWTALSTDTTTQWLIITNQVNLHSKLKEAGITQEILQEHTAIELITDWYCLRQGSTQAFDFLQPASLELYKALVAYFACTHPKSKDPIKQFFAIFFDVMKLSLIRANPNHTSNSVLH